MRILFVIQRYGREVAGGSEQCCREFASRLAARDHQVEVLTSRAASYVDWHDEFDPGDETIDGVTVHRLSVAHRRDPRFFEPLTTRLMWRGQLSAPLVQEAWMRAQGPVLDGFEPWLAERVADFDVVVFFTYLYATTWIGLPVAARSTATVLVPTAHDEAPLWLALFDPVFSSPTGMAYLTEEERALITRRAHRPRPGALIGIGTDTERVGDAAAFRRGSGVGDRPYLLYVGRVDEAKGAGELLEQFVAYRDRHAGVGAGGDLDLVIMGDPVLRLAPHPGVIMTGLVDEQVKADAMAGALALVHPSYFESFSMVLTEAWAQRRPALVQGHSAVLAGQVRRSGGGLAYRNFAEWETAVDLLLADRQAADRMGRAGREYVEAHYRWATVIDRLESLLRSAAATYRAVGAFTPR